MNPTAALRARLIVFFTIGIAAVLAVALWVVNLPQLLGVGRYEVRVELVDAAGLYPSANVTYRGFEIGRVTDVAMTTSGAEAVLSLDSGVAVPMDAPAQVRSMSAVGEQYLEFLPGNEKGPYLGDGAVVAAAQVSLPEPIAGALDQLDETLQSVGNDRLATLLDETYTAVGESDETLRTLIDAAAAVSADGADSADAIAALLDQAGPLLETNVTASESITQWASALAGTTEQLRESDADIRALLDVAAPAAAQVQAMFEEMEPTMPLLLANLITVEQVAAVYRPSLEQMLVLFPSIMASTQSAALPNADDPAQNTFFVNSYNDPPPCIEASFRPSRGAPRPNSMCPRRRRICTASCRPIRRLRCGAPGTCRASSTRADEPRPCNCAATAEVRRRTSGNS